MEEALLFSLWLMFTGYYNVKMLLLRPFILHAAKILPAQNSSASLEEAVRKCVDAAVSTIETIVRARPPRFLRPAQLTVLQYETCRVHAFFRTWYVCICDLPQP